MPELFKRCYDRRALENRVGDLHQLGGITPVVYDEGRARGTRGFLLRTRGGLEVEIVVDRALDCPTIEGRTAARQRGTLLS
jgi:hypothetical protein